MLAQFKQITTHSAEVGARDLQTFLRLVAEGEQNQAEAMLQSNVDLALAAGEVTDLSKRTFTNITGFQYAVWALDWHMWTMIRKYLPVEVASIQMEAFEGAWVKSYGTHFNLDTLIMAYQSCIDLYNAKEYEAGNKTWIEQVGGAQLLLPAHIVNEYCHPTRSLYPIPNFRDVSVLPRSRSTSDAGEWFTAWHSGGKLGEKFACYRGTRGGGRWGLCRGCCGLTVATGAQYDIGSVRALASIRTAQREELIGELKPKKAQRIVA